MKGHFYRALVLLTKLGGSWIFYLFSRAIAAGYFLFSGKVAEGRRFYGILYPDRSPLYHRWCVFRQFQNFTTVYFNRLLLKDLDGIAWTSEGLQHLEKVLGRQGGIILMSHLGNWELAAHLLRKRYDNLKLLLYMGIREKEEIESFQKESLRGSGVRIIAVDKDGGSPFDLVDGVQFLRAGGLVSLTGDQVWKNEQRTVQVNFLGHKAALPETPYIFALLAEVPLFVFFSFRTGKNRYHFFLSDPIPVRAASRAQRTEAIRQAAQKYADLTEAALREHPLEWYHFERFLDP